MVSTSQAMAVMSGFRTPRYNQSGGKPPASQSQQSQYGDAADIYVDNDGN